MKEYETIEVCKNKYEANKRAFLFAIVYPELKFHIEGNKVIRLKKLFF